MAADLHIHVVEPISLEKDVRTSFRETFSTSYYGKDGKCHEAFIELRIKYDGKWYTQRDLFNKFDNLVDTKIQGRREYKLHFNDKAVGETPNVWIGEVSWLKAGLCDDNKTFIPPTVQMVADLIGEKLPVIDDDLIAKIGEAFDSPNPTTYSLNKKAKVIKFLKQYMGKKVYTISW